MANRWRRRVLTPLLLGGALAVAVAVPPIEPAGAGRAQQVPGEEPTCATPYPAFTTARAEAGAAPVLPEIGSTDEQPVDEASGYAVAVDEDATTADALVFTVTDDRGVVRTFTTAPFPTAGAMDAALDDLVLVQNVYRSYLVLRLPGDDGTDAFGWAFGDPCDPPPRILPDDLACPSPVPPYEHATSTVAGDGELTDLGTEPVPWQTAGANVTQVSSTPDEVVFTVTLDGVSHTFTTRPFAAGAHDGDRVPGPEDTPFGTVELTTTAEGTFVTLGRGFSGEFAAFRWRFDDPCNPPAPLPDVPEPPAAPPALPPGTPPPAAPLPGSASYTG